MQSFRTELENSIVEKDILDLAKKIAQFKAGEIHEEKFRSLRLARGVYGQRQQGVQMIRIKLPYGKMQFHQWRRMADISDEYSTGNLHLTTRQDIQIHFVSLDRAPELWSKLEQDDITLREACGNTVRNITASPTSGIDPNELFDVSPHADAAFRYFLRNPICQEMGRKIKISFSNTDEDTSLAYLHDMGFIPKIHQGVRGFRVVVGGGLGAQPMLAYLAHEFLPETEVIPFIESVLRVFDRHGERNSRHKARMKFLIQKIGFEPFMDLVKAETKALKNHYFEISDAKAWEVDVPNLISNVAAPSSTDYETWLATNTFEQKQVGYHAIYVRILNGNISSNTSRSLIEALTGYIGDDVRITINQGLMLKFVPTINLPYVYQVLETHHLAAPGANSIANITACPGTDTCNLAISDSTNITSKLEEVITQEFPSLIHDNQMKIKISGCMNACGQHSMASIGFHGSSLKAPDKRVLPALQVLLGGATLGNGLGKIADKVIKVPSKRGPEALRVLLNNFEENANEGEYFHDFYQRLGENHFYTLLKPLADLQNLANSDFIDWGASENFATEIGVGECAGVMIDLVATLLFDAEEKYGWAHSAHQENRFADAIYHAYSVYISAAKALLLDKSITVSNQIAVINKFDENFVQTGEFDFKGQSFQDVILQINEKTPDEHFAEAYLNQALDFLQSATKYRQASISQ